MTDLEETFGEDFAQGIRQKTAERRQERNSVSEEQMVDICAMAINENKFDEGDPTFEYTTDNGITHNVLLMQVPDMDGDSTVWEYLDEPWDGAAKLPFDYLGEWYWCTFPDKTDLKKFNQGDWGIIVGAVEEYQPDEADDPTYSVYPVRGSATLEEAKEYATKSMSDEGFSPSEEEEEEDSEEEEEDDPSPEKPTFGAGGDESEDDEPEEEVPREKVKGVLDTLAENQDEDEEPQVFDITREHEESERLAVLIKDKIEYEGDAGDVEDVILDVIEEEGSDDEEEEEEDEDEMDSLF